MHRSCLQYSNGAEISSIRISRSKIQKKNPVNYVYSCREAEGPQDKTDRRDLLGRTETEERLDQ